MTRLIDDYSREEYDAKIKHHQNRVEKACHPGSPGPIGSRGAPGIQFPGSQARVSINTGLGLRKDYMIFSKESGGFPYNDLHETVRALKEDRSTIFTLNGKKVYYSAETREIWSEDHFLVSGRGQIQDWFEHIIRNVPAGYTI